MSLVLWFGGLIGVIVAAGVASARGRANPNDVFGRGVIAAAAVAYMAVVVAAVWVWGGATAASGRATVLADGAPVSLTHHGVRVPLERTLAVGHGVDADVRVAGNGADALFQIEVTMAGRARRAIVRAAAPDVVVAPVRFDEDPLAIAAAAAARCKTPASAADAAYTLPQGATVVAVVCAKSKRGFAIRREPAAESVVVAPLAWHGDRFAAERISVRAGDALRIGGGDAPVPGVNSWDVIAPRGSSGMLAVPLDPTACAAWAPGGAERAPRAVAGGCQVDTGAFVVVALPLVPDAALVLSRGGRAAFAIGMPPLVLLVALALMRRRGRRADVLGRALRLCVLGGGLTALVCWRLLWAYRIDVMRELSLLGSRVADNQLAAVAIGAALAGHAVFAVARPTDGGARRWLGALAGIAAAWAGWLVAGWVISGLGAPSLGVKQLGVIALSLVAAVIPLAGDAARRCPKLGPDAALAGIAVAAVAARFVAPSSPLVKLGLAYLVVLAGHAALRVALEHETSAFGRARCLLALAAAALGVAALDAGVALAITGTGLALAMLVAGHDATYNASKALRLGVLEREHARLLLVHGAAAIALAIGVAAVALTASDRELLEHGAHAVLHAPLVFVGLFVLAALVARSHRRGWIPWIAAALAALAIWGARGDLLERATAGNHTASHRVSALVEPGYALLRNERAFAANVAAWQEAAFAPAARIDHARGQGYFGARVRDIGVGRSIDNDYLPVLVARERGVLGLVQGISLLLVIVVGAGALASVRMRHGSPEHRARWLITAVVGAIAVYQPLAALGVLPLTGISWPGLGVDSPADLWLFVIGAAWCLMGGEGAVSDDERVRRTRRLARARRVAIVALAIAAVAAIAIVARAGASALGRVTSDDARIAAALDYADTIKCEWPERSGTALDELVPGLVAGDPTDDATARFERELRAAWIEDRPKLLAALTARAGAEGAEGAASTGTASPAQPLVRIGSRSADDTADDDEPAADPAATASPPAPAASPACRGRAGRWLLARDGDACTATFHAGWPEVKLALRPQASGVLATCSVARDADAIAVLRAPVRPPRAQRIRVVSAAMGAAAGDLGELVAGDRIVRLRAGAPAISIEAAAAGLRAAGEVALAGGVSLRIVEPPRALLAARAAFRRVVLRGPAEIFAAAEQGAWRRLAHDPSRERALDQPLLIVAGPAAARALVLFRPTVDPLLADETNRIGDRARRAYPYGAALAELGWVNPFDPARSLGLDGWIHAAHAAQPAAPAPAATCGTLEPPAIQPAQVCAPSPHDGVVECRVTLQPELALSLRKIVDAIIVDPEQHTGRDVTPTRVAYVALRGDTGELLAQANVVPGRAPLAYAPATAAAEAALVQLREARGESDAERVEWNLPIAVGSTLKAIVARAAEQAFPHDVGRLNLSATGAASGCRARRGPIGPILGHCPPTSVAGQPATADLHDFLLRSPNWYQMALGLVGLGLPDGRLAAGDTPVSLAEIVDSDLGGWPVDKPLRVEDASGPILGPRGVSIAGLRRTPLWSQIERLLGRPLCTLGDRASCERAAARADVCAARGLPIAAPGADLRYLVALGPDRLAIYGDDRPAQSSVPVREYLQLLRGGGAHAVGSLAQVTDAFGRVIYDPEARRLAASWFPAPKATELPDWKCTAGGGRAPRVRGDDGGLCGVLREGGSGHGGAGALLAEPALVVYGAKTGTTDSLAGIARRPRACAAWNARHDARTQLACGKPTPDDSLFVIAFGVATPGGTIPITLGIQLQRAGKGTAARVTPAFVRAIAGYLRGA